MTDQASSDTGPKEVRKLARPWMFGLALALSPLVLLFVLGLMFTSPLWMDSIRERWNRRSFDAARWRAQREMKDPGRWTPRLGMVDDLLERNLLKGMSKEEVLSLLGPPDSREIMLKAPEPEAEYLLGLERGMMGIDEELLSIRFGKDGKLKWARVRSG